MCPQWRQAAARAGTAGGVAQKRWSSSGGRLLPGQEQLEELLKRGGPPVEGSLTGSTTAPPLGASLGSDLTLEYMSAVQDRIYTNPMEIRALVPRGL